MSGRARGQKVLVHVSLFASGPGKTLLMTTCIRQGSALRVSPADFISLFSEGGEEREKERKRNIDMRQKHQSVASGAPPTRGPGLQHSHEP